MINFGIVGALGRMGQAIAKQAAANSNLSLQLVTPVEYATHPNIGKKYNAVTGIAFDAEITSLENAKIPQGGFIDFSHASTVIHTLQKAAEKGVPVVVGTTGFTKEEREALESMAVKIPLIIASNMAIGVNVLFSLVSEAAKALAQHGFDPEVMEIHHKLKKDAPSGTATTLKEEILRAYNRREENVLYGRQGMVGERKADEVGVMALRGGDVVGDHTVYFLGQGERIEIKHQAVSRDTFASGALAALRFLQNKNPGLYSMKDVLGLKEKPVQ
ncbi:MAG: 4-hydroxy-tetrahydrodipicolinate reductase [Turneriella sp.]|nr:4-hydroxy-tetrahydrodipicolinate reductase [Turneriella sp.]